LRVAQQRKCRADAAHHPHHAFFDGLAPLSVGQNFEAARRSRPDGIDEHVEFAVPSLPELGEHLVDLVGVTDVGTEPEGVGATATRQLCHRAVKTGSCPADHRHPGAFLGEATGRRQTHAAATTDDHRCGVRQP
jgi:hypothetical protein